MVEASEVRAVTSAGDRNGLRDDASASALFTMSTLLFLILSLSSCGSAAVDGVPDSSIVWQTDRNASNVSPTTPDGPRVQVSLYDKDEDPNCEGPAEMAIDFDTSQDCYGWRRTVDPASAHNLDPRESTRDNSAACFVCYRDALCFREFTASLVCTASFPGWVVQQSTDKFVTTTSCEEDGAGSVLSRVSSGTENCPETPPGFDQEACKIALSHCNDRHPPITRTGPIKFPAPSLIAVPPYP